MKHIVKLKININKDDLTINSDYMKIVVASFYRYNRGFKYVCTEFKKIDVCASEGSSLIEIECKISKSDLKKELKKKKHDYYSFKKKRKSVIIPNKYYIAITQEMAKDKECFEIINKLNDKYGIIVVESWRCISFEKYAKKLHDDIIKIDDKDKIISRLSSENITLRKKLYDFKKDNKKSTDK